MYRLFSFLLTVAQRKLECLFVMRFSGWANIFNTAGAYPSGASYGALILKQTQSVT